MGDIKKIVPIGIKTGSILLAALLAMFVISSSLAGFAFAKPDRSVSIPSHAVEIADGVFDLGAAEADGKIVRGLLIVHPGKGFGHKPNHNPGGGAGNGEVKCYSFIANGAKWKTTEQYALDTTNLDGISATFVANTIATSFETWDTQVSVDIFGARDASSTVDGADTSSPDGKNEIYFADIDSAGAIAVTIVWHTIGPPFLREIVEFDMVFDDVDFDFGYAGPTSETQLGDTSVMDLQNIATHEDGHAAGLGHPDDSCTEETMYRFASSGETKKRTLHNGDIAGINGLYT